MVKGNADRRRELTRLRQEEERAEVVRKSLGPAFASAAEARARILSDSKFLGSDESDLLGWVVLTRQEEDNESEDQASSSMRNFCEEYFRTGACPLRRCKHAHDVTISNRTGVPSAAGVLHTVSDDSSSSSSLFTAEASSVSSLPSGAIPAMRPLPLRAACGGTVGGTVYDSRIRRWVGSGGGSDPELDPEVGGSVGRDGGENNKSR